MQAKKLLVYFAGCHYLIQEIRYICFQGIFFWKFCKTVFEMSHNANSSYLTAFFKTFYHMCILGKIQPSLTIIVYSWTVIVKSNPCPGIFRGIKQSILSWIHCNGCLNHQILAGKKLFCFVFCFFLGMRTTFLLSIVH